MSLSHFFSSSQSGKPAGVLEEAKGVGEVEQDKSK